MDYRQLPVEAVPAAIDRKEGIGHIYASRDSRLWFCNPCFQEYHELYPEDPWELIRTTDQGRITWIVERACNLVNREKLKPL
jgi:hypothetical protein